MDSPPERHLLSWRTLKRPSFWLKFLFARALEIGFFYVYANAALAKGYVDAGVGSAVAEVWAQLYPVTLTVFAVYLGVAFLSPQWLLYPVFEEDEVREEMQEYLDILKARFRGELDDGASLLGESEQDSEDRGSRQVNGVGEDDSEYESDDELEEDMRLEAHKVRDDVAL